MIVSHKHRFIYIKACKVGGTSVQWALEKICGPDDIIINEDREIGGRVYSQHATPFEVRRLVGLDVWRSYRKIVVIRNPWDALVSLYFFAQVKQQIRDAPAFFGTFVWWNLTGSFPLNKNHFLLEGKRWADDYLRFEELDKDCALLFERLGQPPPILGKEVSGSRPPIHYSLMYNEEAVEWVTQKYAEEIREFNYEFQHIYKRKTSQNRDTTIWYRVS
jgi:hypothetical protein